MLYMKIACSKKFSIPKSSCNVYSIIAKMLHIVCIAHRYHHIVCIVHRYQHIVCIVHRYQHTVCIVYTGISILYVLCTQVSTYCMYFAHRYQHIVCIVYTGISILYVKQAEKTVGIWSFLQPFDLYLWVAIGSAFFGTTLILYAIGRFVSLNYKCLNMIHLYAPTSMVCISELLDYLL